MRQFYRYIIYTLYSWRLKRKDDTPATTVIFLITIVHTAHLLSLEAIISSIFGITYLLPENRWLITGLFFAFIGLHYVIFYNKLKWENYIEEFKNESPIEKKRGSIKVIGYLVGSVLLFFVLLPVIFGF